MGTILPDLVATGLKLLICGTAAGNESARIRAHYADPTNQFWKMLHRLGVTPRVFEPTEFQKLRKLGIGLTDSVKNASGADSTLDPRAFDVGRLRATVLKIRPGVLAFNGKKAAKVFCHLRKLEYGYQNGMDIGKTQLWVMPSTSGAARRWWNENIWRMAIKTARLRDI